jgi:hypothetical protein
VDAILLLIQVGREGDWTDRGLPELVMPSNPKVRDARSAGVEWLLEHHPGASANDWRLLVWDRVRERPWKRDEPAAIITPTEYRVAIGRERRGESTIRRRPLRVERNRNVATKIAVTEVGLGDRILVTQNRENTAATQLPGPWFPANEPGEDTVSTRVTGVSQLTRHGEQTITLITRAGELPGLSIDQSILPVEET